ncbi:MAG: MarR family winged helix-turn-helix transcriptional regulator [Bacteriovoracia bacterium]
MSDFERSLFSLLDISGAIHQFNKASEQRLGISLVQWCLLRNLIDMPSATAQALAAAAGVHPSTLTQTLKRLARKGFVFITEDPRDSRKRLVSITRAGKECLEKSSPQLREWLSELGPLSADLSSVSAHLSDQVIRHRKAGDPGS